jgi:hypothetical protein
MTIVWVAETIKYSSLIHTSYMLPCINLNYFKESTQYADNNLYSWPLEGGGYYNNHILKYFSYFFKCGLHIDYLIYQFKVNISYKPITVNLLSFSLFLRNKLLLWLIVLWHKYILNIFLQWYWIKTNYKLKYLRGHGQ